MRRTIIRCFFAALSLILILSTVSGCTVFDIVDEILDRMDSDGGDAAEYVETQPPAVVIDLDELPSRLEPIEGYCPYIVRFYYQDGSLLVNRAPYLIVTDKYNNSVQLYSLYDAYREGLVEGFSAYMADGTECDPDTVVRLQEAMYGDPERVHYNGSAVYVFYLRNDIEAELRSISHNDYLTLGSLENFYLCWENACFDRHGWCGQYRTFILEPSVDIGDGMSVTEVNITLDSYSAVTDVKGVMHYYYFIQDTSTRILPIGQ